MIILLKLGTLALRTFSKPIANKLKKGAGLQPRFRDFIINVAQVAGAAIIYEVHRNARAEARKEEHRKQEIETLTQKSRNLEKEVENLRQKLQWIETLSKRRSFLDYFKFWHWSAQST